MIESLIAQVFECYFTAGDAQGVGAHTPGQEGESQAAVLRPAVELFKCMSMGVAVGARWCWGYLLNNNNALAQCVLCVYLIC